MKEERYPVTEFISSNGTKLAVILYRHYHSRGQVENGPWFTLEDTSYDIILSNWGRGHSSESFGNIGQAKRWFKRVTGLDGRFGRWKKVK